MIQWSWAAGATAPRRAQYLKNGKPSSLAGADVSLELFDIDSGRVEHDGLEVTVEAGDQGYVSFAPAGDSEAATFIGPGRYYARLRIVDQVGVIDYLPVDKRQFEITVYSDIKEAL